jgi:hypothetical protein
LTSDEGSFELEMKRISIGLSWASLCFVNDESRSDFGLLVEVESVDNPRLSLFLCVLWRGHPGVSYNLYYHVRNMVLDDLVDLRK